MKKAIFVVAVLLFIVISSYAEQTLIPGLVQKKAKKESKNAAEMAKVSAIDVDSAERCAQLVTDSCYMFRKVEVDIYLAESNNMEEVQRVNLGVFTPGKDLTREIFKSRLEQKILSHKQGDKKYVIKFFEIIWKSLGENYSLFDSDCDGQWDTACCWKENVFVSDMKEVQKHPFRMVDAERLFE